jgi:hypothetical protein
MEFDQSTLRAVVEDISMTGGNQPLVRYSALVYYNETEYVEPLRVISVDKMADYMNAFTDGIIISAIILAGDYAYNLTNNRNTLSVELVTSAENILTDTSERESRTTVQRYKAVMINTEDDVANQYSAVAVDQFKLNMFDFRIVRFQLLDEFVEKLRVAKIGTIFRFNNAEEILRTTIHETCELFESKIPFEGVDIQGISRSTADTQVIAPQGMRLVDLPKYLQESERGVYGTGLSAFYREGHYYVWPTFDVTRFTKSEIKLTIINVPQTRFPGLDRTYKYQGNHLTIVTTGTTVTADNSDTLQMTVGNTSQTGSAGALHNGTYSKTENNKTLAQSRDILSEITSNPRLDNIQQTEQKARIKITDNTLNELSKSAMSAGNVMQLVWENSFHEAITPGMPCRIQYWDGAKVIERDGVVIATQSYTHPAGGNLLRGRYVTATGVYVFLSKEVNT